MAWQVWVSVNVCLKHYLIVDKNNLPAVHKCQHFHECTHHTLSETTLPSKEKSTHQHFLSVKNLPENNKKSGQKVKSVQKTKC